MSGDFVWHELLTSNPNEAVSFYSAVVGWTTQLFDNSPMEYRMWVGSQGPLGGVMKLPDAAARMNAPPHWTSNVTVDDVDDTARRVAAMGGKILQAPVDMPTVGRFAVIADPQGAVIAIFKPTGEMKPHDVSKAGEFAWNELMTTDANAAFAFYSEIFGWKKIQSMDMGPMGTYEVFGKGDKQLGGMMNKPPQMPAAAWQYYIQVDELDAAVARAKANGGKLLNGPMDVPGGRVAQLADPQGVFFALHTSVKA